MWKNEISSDYFSTLRATAVIPDSLTCLINDSRLSNLVVYYERILWHGNVSARFAWTRVHNKGGAYVTQVLLMHS